MTTYATTDDLLTDRVEALYGPSLGVALGNNIAAIGGGFIFWHRVEAELIIAWCVWWLCHFAVRFGVWLYYRRRRGALQPITWARVYLALRAVPESLDSR